MKKLVAWCLILILSLPLFACSQYVTPLPENNYLDPEYETSLHENDYLDPVYETSTSEEYYVETGGIIETNGKTDIVDIPKSGLAVGTTIILGSYEQDNDVSNGSEPIEWLVLEQNGSQYLVISRYVLDCLQYNDEIYRNAPKTALWETCSLRKWLNETFLTNAFTTEEQTRILYTTVTADLHPSYDTNQGNNTYDKVFLLSFVEAEKYFNADAYRECAARRASGTAYSSARFQQHKDYAYRENYWWLRTLGSESPPCAAFVGEDGEVFENGSYQWSYCGVRPAMWISF